MSTEPSTDGNDGTDTLVGVEKAEFKGGVQVALAAPIVLDLNGDGVSLIDRKDSRTTFDWDGDGIRNQTGWIGKDDGFLIFDRNGDGRVSNASELSFVDDKPGAKSDLDGLSAFDSNQDGLFSAEDEQFGSFRIWRDANGNGKSDRGELKRLSDMGVESITLAGTAVDRTWGWDENITINTGSFTRTDGTVGAMGDVALNYASKPSSADRSAAIGYNRRFGAASFSASQLVEAMAAFVGDSGSDDLAKHDMFERREPLFAVSSAPFG